MSGGEQQMVSFGRALMSEPRLILVDELSLGLMPKAAGVFVEVLARLQTEGVAALLVDQSTNRVLRLADEVTLLSTGRAVFTGSAAACAADSKLFERFIGTAL
jgi:branched-chain amino acid transport system ATP-binding protein